MEKARDNIELRSYNQQASIAANIAITTVTAFVLGMFIGNRWWGGNTVRSQTP